MREFESWRICRKLETIIDVSKLKQIWNDLMAECWADMQGILDSKAYIHCYLHYNDLVRIKDPNGGHRKVHTWGPDRILSKSTLRKIYNGIRGYDDSNEATFDAVEKYIKTWTYDTGWMMYFYAGEENMKSGDPQSYQNIYKFIPNRKTLEKYKDVIDAFKEQVDIKLGGEIGALMFTLLPPGSGLDWHVDTGMKGRYHVVVENDGTTPSMVFKINGKVTPLPAVQGDTYFANIQIPHCVPISQTPRLHLLGCIDDPDEDDFNSRHQEIGESDQTWADWKKDLGV